MRAQANGGDITVVNLGAITTRGPGAHGIYATGASTTAQSNVNITNQGALSVGLDGDLVGSRAIYVIARSTGNVAISGSGPITVNGNPNALRAYGIIVSADQGAINIDYGGSISVRGQGAGGIRADSVGGNVDVRFTGARIETGKRMPTASTPPRRPPPAPLMWRLKASSLPTPTRAAATAAAGGHSGCKA